MIERHLSTFSVELLQHASHFMDVETLAAVSLTSKRMYCALVALVEARCKRECFSAFIYPTIATYRMIAAVPATWRELYFRFSRLLRMEWTPCKSQGASTSLRTLKSDNQEYAADLDGEFLIRSGGHYWFSVLQTPLADITLANPATSMDEAHHDSQSTSAVFDFMTSTSSIDVGKWEKIRAAGTAPCPRRHHSMTCLPTISASRNIPNSDVSDSQAPMRRILFFGGQSEGIPFDAFNDVHLLVIDGTVNKSRSHRALARWIQPQTLGRPPSRRCGHSATMLSNDTILISGGSDGTTPLLHFEVFLLHITPDSAFGEFRWSTPAAISPPSGRAMHSVYRLARDEVLVFGGRQIRQSNGVLDVQHLKLRQSSCLDEWQAEWSEPALHGCVPAPRRGHSTIAIGNRLLLIGGQDESTGELSCDVRILHTPLLQWYQPTFETDERPCPRRGFKTQYFGTSLAISSGFVMNEQATKCDVQLPDSDIHVLTFK